MLENLFFSKKKKIDRLSFDWDGFTVLTKVFKTHSTHKMLFLQKHNYFKNWL